MKLFDENGSFVGEFIEASGEVIDKTKETVSDAFSSSLALGILGFMIAPWWTLFAIVVIFVFKLLIAIIKLSLRIAWWLIRLPFTLIFKKEFPSF